MKQLYVYLILLGAIIVLLGGYAKLPTARLVDSPSQTVLRVPQEYTTIQAAVDAASDGATIQIAPGIYAENLKITKSLHLEGSGIDVTYLEPVLGFRNQHEFNPVISVQARQEIQLRLSSLTISQPAQQPSGELLRYGSFDQAIGLLIEEGADDKLSLFVNNTRWTRLEGTIHSLKNRLRYLGIHNSHFERNTNATWNAMEADIVGNLFFENSAGPQIHKAKRLRVQDNAIIGTSVTQTEVDLVLDEGGRGEVTGNTIANASYGLRINQSGQEATWIVRGNRLVGNIRNISISAKEALARFDILVEENIIVDGHLGIEILVTDVITGGWGEIRLHRNHILRQQAVRHPEDPNVKDDLFSSHGIHVYSFSREWPRGRVKIEFIGNQIEFNEGWGLAINYGMGQKVGQPPYYCLISDLEHEGKQIVPPLIVGRDNIFRSNGKGDL
ncbi:MAG: hypothetical protein QW570_08965, partial [Candidatus Caldarchaeum sp.]